MVIDVMAHSAGCLAPFPRAVEKAGRKDKLPKPKTAKESERKKRRGIDSKGDEAEPSHGRAEQWSGTASYSIKSTFVFRESLKSGPDGLEKSVAAASSSRAAMGLKIRSRCSDSDKQPARTSRKLGQLFTRITSELHERRLQDRERFRNVRRGEYDINRHKAKRESGAACQFGNNDHPLIVHCGGRPLIRERDEDKDEEHPTMSKQREKRRKAGKKVASPRRLRARRRLLIAILLEVATSNFARSTRFLFLTERWGLGGGQEEAIDLPRTAERRAERGETSRLRTVLQSEISRAAVVVSLMKRPSSFQEQIAGAGEVCEEGGRGGDADA
ncbi:hypothetical protein KM043_005477 [Ampulex compressa]|nr:hypothetical protein KM043_005477 [Ampulex compressa]